MGRKAPCAISIIGDARMPIASALSSATAAGVKPRARDRRTQEDR